MRKWHQVLYKWEVYELRWKRPNKLKTGILCAIKHLETKKILNWVDIDDIDKLPNDVSFKKWTDEDIDKFIWYKEPIFWMSILNWISVIERKVVKKMLIKLWLYRE